MSDAAPTAGLDDPKSRHAPPGGCEWPGCVSEAQHRAPKSPDTLREYYWFCLDHVRAYNKAWNYYEGMDEGEIEREIRNDTCWRRPTWPMGASRNGQARPGGFDDAFGIFEDADRPDAGAREAEADARTPQGRAYRALGLRPPTTLTELKARYKHLVKRLHPDVNGGDKDAEDRLKEINQAYATLKSHLAG